MHEFRIPKLGLGDDEPVHIVAWCAEEGQPLKCGDPLLEVETDKAAMDVEAPVDGVLAYVALGAGSTSEAGALAAYLAEPGESYDRAELERAAQDEARADEVPAGVLTSQGSAQDVDGSTSRPAGHDEAVRARQPAVARGDLRGFPPSPGQTVSAGTALRSGLPDLHDAARRLGSYQAVPLTKQRSAIARTMSEAAAIPQFAVGREIEVTPLRRVLQDVVNHGLSASFSDVMVWCLARALSRAGTLNAWYNQGEILKFDDVNVGLAVDTPDGVVAPVLHDVQGTPFPELVAKRTALVSAARSGTLAPTDLLGATFTLSNVGPLGADVLHPILTPPQTGVLGLGRARDADNGSEWVSAVLVADHRAVDGADGARFLAELAGVLSGLETAELMTEALPMTNGLSDAGPRD